jgi:primosomal protein N' (replication factor Y)
VCPVDGTTRPVVCAQCGGLKFKLLRPGIARIAEDLRALARREVVEVTAETTTTQLSGDGLFVGTEALLHRLSSARAVAFLDFDQELSVPRTRAAENAFALLALAARRLGPRDGGGRLLIQTRRPDHIVIDAARHGDPDRVARPQRDIRRVFGQPPYGAWAIVGGPGAPEFVAAVGMGVEIHRMGSEWRLSATDHPTLLDALARTERPTERVRIEVDPIDR